MLVRIKCEICGNRNLTYKKGKYQGFYCSKCDDMCEVELKEVSIKKPLTVRLEVENMDFVKRTIRIINNCIYEEGGIISDYNNELLISLLGVDWSKKWFLGKIFIPENE